MSQNDPLDQPSPNYLPGGQQEQGHGVVQHDPVEVYQEPTSQGLTLSTASLVSFLSEPKKYIKIYLDFIV